MRTTRLIQIVSCHAEGEVGDVIVGGVAPPPGDTLWEQSRFIARDQALRNFVLNEPRGGVFRHVNLLVPPRDPRGFVHPTNPGWNHISFCQLAAPFAGQARARGTRRTP